MDKSDKIQEDQEIKGGIVKVRGRSLFIRNEIYQIPNISTISVIDFSATRPISKVYPVVTFGGIVAAILLPNLVSNATLPSEIQDLARPQYVLAVCILVVLVSRLYWR